jgi:hypothetical protein
LRCPTFLDSSTLTNLTTLFEQGVQKSDVLVVLATRNVLSRPWCLLEILEATRHNVPLLLLEMRGSGFVKEEAHAFVTALETELPKHNEQAYQTLVQYLGTNSLAELKAAVLTLLLKAPVVEWNASARDEQVRLISRTTYPPRATSRIHALHRYWRTHKHCVKKWLRYRMGNRSRGSHLVEVQ